MITRLRTTWRRQRRRLCGLILLLGLCASILPIPVSSPVQIDKDRSQPFPCQDRPCGCRSAEQCWKKCCCFTNSQKLAWANANRVSVPDHVHVAAAQESKPPVCRKPCCEKKSADGLCCRSSDLLDNEYDQIDHNHDCRAANCPLEKCGTTVRVATTLANRRLIPGFHDAERRTALFQQAAKTVIQHFDEDHTVNYVMGVLAEQCRGQSSYWNSLPRAVVPDAFMLHVNWDLESIEWPQDLRLSCVSDQPPEPPPRRSRANIFI